MHPPPSARTCFIPSAPPFAHAGARNLLFLYLKLEVKYSGHPFGCAM
jgi:hypothetical protein